MIDSKASSSRSYLPWPLIGAAGAAMAAMYSTSHGFIGLPFAMFIIILSRLLPFRLPRSRTISWGLRIGIIVTLITLINGQADQDNTPWYLKQADTNLCGFALAAELAVRAWERREPAGQREWIGAGLLVSALLFAASTNIYQRRPIEFLTPVYCIFLVLTLRSMTRVEQHKNESLKFRGGLLALRAFVLTMAIALSFSAVYLVTQYESQVSNWAVRMFKRQRTTQSDIGFSTTPRLSNVFNPLPSPDRVLIIHGRTTEGHLRVMSFDTYSAEKWTPTLGERKFHPAEIKSPPPTNASPMHVERIGDTADLLPVPLSAAAVSAEEPLELDEYGTVRDTMSGAGLSYDVLAAPSPEYQGPLAGQMDDTERKKLLLIPPEVDGRVKTIATQAAGEGDAVRKLFRIQQALRGKHEYSLSYEPQGEPLSDFILNNRSAHCQYFASAMVIMSRAAGIPARYVTGFFAHEPYGTDQTVVRQRDAHAWAECFIDGAGWVTIDATPASGLPNAIYDDPSWWEKWREKLSDIPAKVRAWVSSKTHLLQWLLIIGAPVAIVAWVARRIIERRRKGLQTTSEYVNPNEQLVELATRFENWMRRLDRPCAPQMTWREHLVDFPEESPRRFVNLYERARFGSVDETTVSEATAVLGELEREVR